MPETFYDLCPACQQRMLPRIAEGSRATARKCQNPECGQIFELRDPTRPDLDKR